MSQSLRRWFQTRQLAGVPSEMTRATQLDKSSVPVDVEDEHGDPVTVDVPLVPAVAEGVRAGAVATEALEHADQAAADALQAAIDAAAAQSKAQEALDAALLAVVSSVIEYAVGESDTVPPTVGWSTDNPAPDEGEFVWMRTVVSYADESTATSTPVLMSRGGGEAVKIDSLTTFYAVVDEGDPLPAVPTTVTPSSPWVAVPPAYVAESVLVSTERIIYSDESFAYTEPKVNPDWVSAGKALAEAEATRFLAEGLYQVIPSTTAPTTSPTGALKQGDQWWKIGTGADANRFVGVAVWDGTAWQDRQIVADSVLVPGSVGPVLIEDGAITGQKIAADAIDGKTITGATVRTAEAGQRVQMDLTGIGGFSASGTEVFRLAADSGGLNIGLAGSGYRFLAGRDSTGAHSSVRGAPGDEATLFIDEALGSAMSLGFNQTGSGLILWASPNQSRVDSIHSLRIGAPAIDLHGRTTTPGNVFASKAALDLWADAIDGTVAWVTSEQRQYVRTGGVWVPWYDGAGDMPWTDISTPSGWSTDRPIRVCRRNGVIYWQGRLTPTSARSGTVTVILGSSVPSWAVPESVFDSMRMLPSEHSSGDVSRKMKAGGVGTSGAVTVWYGTSNSDPINLAGLSGYTVD